MKISRYTHKNCSCMVASAIGASDNAWGVERMHVLIALNAYDAPAGEIDGLIAARGWRATTIFPHAGGDPLPATPEGFV